MVWQWQSSMNGTLSFYLLTGLNTLAKESFGIIGCQYCWNFTSERQQAFEFRTPGSEFRGFINRVCRGKNWDWKFRWNFRACGVSELVYTILHIFLQLLLKLTNYCFLNRGGLFLSCIALASEKLPKNRGLFPRPLKVISF